LSQSILWPQSSTLEIKVESMVVVSLSLVAAPEIIIAFCLDFDYFRLTVGLLGQGFSLANKNGK
jgi:hypothetical protein